MIHRQIPSLKLKVKQAYTESLRLDSFLEQRLKR